ncbi:hypothetical protein V865_006295 [Kwoniella europaea PYCC6329]|uniref:Uncharacterized protein n=1 Tax=Kwoniella europaea PYCC6329 TaxID=1423913 RepID=A0AAX4KQE8_9TREE
MITSDISQFKEAFFQLMNRESEDIVRDARLNRITVIDPSEMPFLDDLKQEMTESLDEACQERNQASNNILFHKTYFTDEFDDFHLAARPTTDRYGSLIDCSRWEYAEPYEDNTNTTIKRRYNPNYMLRANQRYRDSLRR